MKKQRAKRPRKRDSAIDEEAREQQMRMLAEAVEISSDLVGMADCEGHFIFVNRAFLRILGYPKEQVIGRHFSCFHSANNPPTLNREIGEKSFQDEGWRGECLLSRGDGTDLPVFLNLGPAKDRQGRVIGNLGVGRDISEQKRVEEALRQSEERVRLLLDSTAEAIYGVDMEGNCTLCNPACARSLGYDSPADLHGKHMHALVHHTRPDGTPYPSRECRIYEALRTNKGTHTDDEVFWRKDGSSFPIEYWSHPIRRDGQVIGAVATFIDITGRKKTEDALKQSEAKFKTLFETANDAILTLKGETFWDCNLRAETLFGCGKEDIVGHHPLEFSPPVQPDGRLSSEKSAEKIQAVLAGPPQFFEWRIVRPDGTPVDVEISLNRVITPEAEYLQTIVRDITERKQAESSLREAHLRLNIALQESEQQARDAVKLTELIDILQSCQTIEEAYKITGSTLPKILSCQAGALCITSPSRNTVEAVATWGDAVATEKTFAPDKCWALRRGKIHMVHDSTSALRCAHLKEFPPAGYLCVPLAAHGETLGVLYLECSSRLTNPSPGPAADEMEALGRQARAVGERISSALANLRLRDVLRSQSIRDPLTGLFNRRYMEESFERELRRAARNSQPVALVMLDIDNFKQFNDTFGHQAGDTLLRALGDFVLQRTRGQDVACRYGGEEFAIVLADATAEAACKRIEILREELKQLSVQHAGQVLGRISFSIGIAVFPDHGATVEELLHAADRALYRAKAKGRDRVVLA
jgi:diguanylate cyclase (GGDEF)-like protein/PAS domain S-box-containing protein